MLTGADYISKASQLNAVAPGAPASVVTSTPSYSSQVDDVGGALSGTIGAGSDQCAVLIGDGQSYVIDFHGAALPPLGSSIRALVQIDSTRGTSRYKLIGWAFGSDVARAKSKPHQVAKTSVSRHGASLASRGGYVPTRFDRRTYFNQYALAISHFNPRLSSEEVDDITKVLLDTSAECDVDPRLVMAVVLAESGFNPSATSRTGAMGLGQLMPGTARGMGVNNPYDSKQNLEASIRIIHSSLSKYSGGAAFKDLNWRHLQLALAAYNAGSGAVRRYGGVPPYRETQNYVVKVSRYFRQLCGGK